MAKVASLSRPAVLVIDTSYLLELYQVPGCFDKTAHAVIKARFKMAIEQKSERYVPFPVILEMANHIAHGRDGVARKKLAKLFVDHILQSFDKGQPFVITPALDEESLKRLLQQFAAEFAHKRVGLTDTSIISEANRLKQKYGDAYTVHIWTKDRGLKSYEPDHEPDPFVL